MRTGRRGRTLCALLAAAVLALVPARAGASEAPVSLRAWTAPCDDWAATPSAATVAATAAREALWLEVPAGASRGESWVVAMPSNRPDALWSYAPPAYAAERLDISQPGAWQISFRYLGREVTPAPQGATYLCFAGRALRPSELVLGPAAEFRTRDLAHQGWISACFGVIVAMSLFALAFLIALRERVFALYLGYLAAFLLFLLTETKAAHRLPLLWQLDPEAMTRLSGVAIDLASGLALLFVLSFTQLRRRLPRLARWMHRIAVVLLPLAAVHGLAHLAGMSSVVRASIHASNVLVTAGALSTLVGGALAARGGDRYARFLLVGWTPLVVAATTASIQQIVQSRTTLPVLDFTLLAGTFESVVLALGLADRTLSYRRELASAREMADRDALSGLLNRRALLRLSDALAGDSRRWGSSLSVVMFDLDHFKRVNDEHGHSVGDACIRRFAEDLAAEARDSDLVARYGGEEFLAVLPGATAFSARSFAERVRSRLAARAVEADGHLVALTVSAGAATGRSHDRVETLIARADQALYRAKHGGRNQVAAELAV